MEFQGISQYLVEDQPIKTTNCGCEDCLYFNFILSMPIPTSTLISRISRTKLKPMSRDKTKK